MPGSGRGVAGITQTPDAVSGAGRALRHQGQAHRPLVNDGVAGADARADRAAVAGAATDGMTVTRTFALRDTGARALAKRIAPTRPRANRVRVPGTGHDDGARQVVGQDERRSRRTMGETTPGTTDRILAAPADRHPDDRNVRGRTRMLLNDGLGRKQSRNGGPVHEVTDRRVGPVAQRGERALDAVGQQALDTDRTRVSRKAQDAAGAAAAADGITGPARTKRTAAPRAGAAGVTGPLSKTVCSAGAVAGTPCVAPEALVLGIPRAVAPAEAEPLAVPEHHSVPSATVAQRARAEALRITGPRSGTARLAEAGTGVTRTRTGAPGSTLVTDRAAGAGTGAQGHTRGSGAMGRETGTQSPPDGIPRPGAGTPGVAGSPACTPGMAGPRTLTKRGACTGPGTDGIARAVARAQGSGDARTGNDQVDGLVRAADHRTRGQEPAKRSREGEHRTVRSDDYPAKTRHRITRHRDTVRTGRQPAGRGTAPEAGRPGQTVAAGRAGRPEPTRSRGRRQTREEHDPGVKRVSRPRNGPGDPENRVCARLE